MDWHTFFKELKDSGRAAGLFMLLVAGVFAGAVAILLGSELMADGDGLTLAVRGLQVVLTLSLLSLVGLPLYAWRGRGWPASPIGRIGPRRTRARKRLREDS